MAGSQEEPAVTPAARSVGSAVVTCPEVAWHKVFSALPLPEVARSALALLSNQTLREAIGSAWDPNAVLREPWPKGLGGLGSFLAAARATYLSASAHRSLQNEAAAARWKEARPRSVAIQGSPSAMAFSVGHEEGDGLLAAAVGRDVKLLARETLAGCGSIALALPKGCREAGGLAFSPDGGALAVVPATEPGGLASEVHFYSTDGDKAKPVVAKLHHPLTSMDFLHVGPRSGGDLAAASGAELCQVSPSTGGVVAQWKAQGSIESCRAVSTWEVMTIAGRAVEIWDLRTAEGVARRAEVPEPATALDVGAFKSSSSAFVGDALGGLHCVDWRGPSSELLWRPSAGQSGPVRRLMVERGCACLLTPLSIQLLALQPCAFDLGTAPVERLGALASAPGVWAFAAQQPAKQGLGSVVSVVDWSGNAAFERARREASAASAQKAENQKKQKEKKKESQGKKPSCGKAAHGRNSGR